MRVLFINFTILLIILFSPALFYQIYKIFKIQFTQSSNQKIDARANYPTYDNRQFADEIFAEYNQISSKYRSFLGWRNEKLNLKYTNISGPYSVRKSKGEALNKSVWFFGGSTMLGVGVSDSQTIPSHFNSLSNTPVYNFGVVGWNSRQSLNQLINVIGDGHKPSIVVFYDGVNDVFHQCRKEIQLLPAHNREQQLQNSLKGPSIQSIKKNILITILAPYIAFSDKLGVRLPFNNLVNPNDVGTFADFWKDLYDCDTNQLKAELIAKHLVNNWQTAYALSKIKGFELYGILQPTLFSTKTNSEYLTNIEGHPVLKRQYDTVYPLILKEIKSQCEYDKDFCSFMINGTDWLDGRKNVFIDFNHVNSLGNKLIAKRIKSLLKN